VRFTSAGVIHEVYRSDANEQSILPRYFVPADTDEHLAATRSKSKAPDWTSFSCHAGWQVDALEMPGQAAMPDAITDAMVAVRITRPIMVVIDILSFHLCF
jgi:hypothetical protein